jgi:mRNA interferase MazF
MKTGDANLPKPGVVNITQIFTVNKVELGERMGRLSARIVDEIRSGLELLFDRV